MSNQQTTEYVPRYLPEGTSEHTDDKLVCELRPQTGEYLNQSGLYSEVIAVLQHFDAGPVEVFLKPLGDSEQFLQYLNSRQ